jgi:hypothetical protein
LQGSTMSTSTPSWPAVRRAVWLEVRREPENASSCAPPET